ncbi:hypothetical protein [Indiicoccus explosivorum]|uniref:hypothetical protein n=1 Tax=Indiicoccus explosivorum TaxID=1917864 RepID=UPI0013DE1FD3|nr:hypothetical protein [Indiicoccus explosivorum]
MEQAFRDKHGFGMNEYKQDPELLIEVEKRRERDYNKEQRIVSNLERQIHRNDIG